MWGLKEVVAISAGGSHYMALTSAGHVYTWGTNLFGQLGNGSTGEQVNPARVSDLINVVSISAGFSHSLAVCFDGKVYAWGRNKSGQLGVKLRTCIHRLLWPDF